MASFFVDETRTDYAYDLYKTLLLVRIPPLISASKNSFVFLGNGIRCAAFGIVMIG